MTFSSDSSQNETQVPTQVRGRQVRGGSKASQEPPVYRNSHIVRSRFRPYRKIMTVLVCSPQISRSGPQELTSKTTTWLLHLAARNYLILTLGGGPCHILLGPSQPAATAAGVLAQEVVEAAEDGILAPGSQDSLEWSLHLCLRGTVDYHCHSIEKL